MCLFRFLFSPVVYPFSACHLVTNFERKALPDHQRDIKSQGKNIYISLKEGGGKREKWVGGVDSGIRRMCYFCRIWAGISSISGLNASLSYKDKYIIESGGETETCGMTDV